MISSGVCRTTPNRLEETDPQELTRVYTALETLARRASEGVRITVAGVSGDTRSRIGLVSIQNRASLYGVVVIRSTHRPLAR